MNKRDSSDVVNDINHKYKSNDNFDVYTKFKIRFVVYDILMLLFVFVGVFLIRKSFLFIDSQVVTYKETSNLDYNVVLKPNEFYETDSLGKGMVYVASLIDKVDVDFNYNFSLDKKSDINFDYDIVGRLVITDKNNDNNVFFEKKYVLLENVSEKMSNDKAHDIKQKVSIDYNYYNDLANKFRIKYGIDASCNLIVSLNIHEKNNSTNVFSLDNNSLMSLTIPLSQKAINISMDYKEINRTNKLVREEDVVLNDYIRLGIGILSLLVGLYFLIKYIGLLFKLRVKKSKFDKYVNRILNEYDRLIVETSTPPIFKGKDVIDIHKFQELLDVRDNLRLPIKYYVVEKHKKCNFYINHDDEIYIHTIKFDDVK